MKQAGRVRRPFHAQALAIIQLCRTLVNVFKEESNHTADNVLPLEECVGVPSRRCYRDCLLTWCHLPNQRVRSSTQGFASSRCGSDRVENN
jgi:hypothetical protein